MKKYIKEIKSAIVFSLVVISIFGITGFAYSMLSSLKVTSNADLTSALWNDLVDHSVPTGAINAFYGSSCPTGWNAADGSGDEVMTDGSLGTLDLRGQFLRGMNDFGTGLRSDGKQNPESKALGDYQADEFKNHNHQIRTIRRDSDNQYSFEIAGEQRGDSNAYDFTNSSLTGGNETRPKNVSVIFCIKE